MDLRRRAYELLVAQAARRRSVRRAGELLSPRQRRVRSTRNRLARDYLKGEGLEIGALHLPLPLPRGARARYVDRMPADALRREYPELRSYDLVDVDVIDDGETLASVPDGSADFLVANHFIEHTEDPIATLGNHLRVLRPGGVLFMAVPDKRRTFDASRPVTPLEHLVRDHAEGPSWSHSQHFEEWAREVEGVPEPEVAERARRLDEEGFSIHFHVFTPATFDELVHHCRREEGLPVEVEALVPVEHEFIAVLRKEGGARAGWARHAAAPLAARRAGA